MTKVSIVKFRTVHWRCVTKDNVVLEVTHSCPDLHSKRSPFKLLKIRPLSTIQEIVNAFITRNQPEFKPLPTTVFILGCRNRK